MPNTIYLGAHFSCIKFSSFTLFFVLFFVAFWFRCDRRYGSIYLFIFAQGARAQTRKESWKAKTYITQQKSLVRAPLKVNFFLLIFLRWVKNYFWTRRLRELLRSHWVQSAITDENNIKKTEWTTITYRLSFLLSTFDFDAAVVVVVVSFRLSFFS